MGLLPEYLKETLIINIPLVDSNNLFSNQYLEVPSKAKVLHANC